MAYNASGLTNYVEVNKDVLIKDIVLGAKYGDTIANLRKQLGVKTKERLNYLDVTPVLQDGTGCGFSASGSTNFSEREIETAPFKVNDKWCPDDLLGKFAEYLVRYGANANAEDGMPFEREIMSEIEKGIAKQLEKMVWQGDKSGSDLIDGFLTQALGADNASTVAVSYTAAQDEKFPVYQAMKALIKKIPEDILDDAVIFVSPAVFRSLALELSERISTNLYEIKRNENGEVIEDNDLVFPGTSVRIHKTRGLEGDVRHAYCSVYDNMVYAADMMNDKEEIRLWFSDDDDLYKLKIKWNAGVKTLYPDAVVVLTSTTDLA
jgi:hypothetical protein